MSTVTVDGSNGPGFVLDNVVFNNIDEIDLISSKRQIRLIASDGDTTYIDISTAATIVVTLVGGVGSTNYTVTIST